FLVLRGRQQTHWTIAVDNHVQQDRVELILAGDRVREVALTTKKKTEIWGHDGVCRIFQGVVRFHGAHAHAKQQVGTLFRVGDGDGRSGTNMDFTASRQAQYSGVIAS